MFEKRPDDAIHVGNIPLVPPHKAVTEGGTKKGRGYTITQRDINAPYALRGYHEMYGKGVVYLGDAQYPEGERTGEMPPEIGVYVEREAYVDDMISTVQRTGLITPIL